MSPKYYKTEDYHRSLRYKLQRTSCLNSGHWDDKHGHSTQPFKGDQSLVLLLLRKTFHFIYIWGQCPRKLLKLAMCTLNLSIYGGRRKKCLLGNSSNQKKKKKSSPSQGTPYSCSLTSSWRIRTWLKRKMVLFACAVTTCFF